MTRRAHPSHPLDGILASPCPPPVVFYHHPYHSPADAWPSWNADGNACVVRVDAAKHSSARSVYTALVREAWRVVSAFTGIQDGREKGQHAGWDGRDVVHLDGLVRGLRRICASVALAGGPQTLEQNGASGKSKEVESNTTGPARSLVLAIHHAEQLHRAAGSGWGVLTRLPDILDSAPGPAHPLAPLSIVLTSAMPWDLVRPATSDAVEPFHVYLDRPSKIDTLRALLASPAAAPHAHNPLFPPFLVVLYAALAHLIPRDIEHEMERLIACCWEVWIDSAPKADLDAHLDGGPMPCATRPPPSHALITALTRASAPAFLAANDLVTRRTTPQAFAEQHVPSRVRERAWEREARGEGVGAFMSLAREVAGCSASGSGGMANPFMDPVASPSKASAAAATAPAMGTLGAARPPRLPYYAKYLVLAAYFASFNPRATDLRLFGRGPLAEPFKGRKKGGGMRRVGASNGLGARNIAGRVGKIPQRLLGPKSFPLERLLAIFQSLLAEHGFAHHHSAAERGVGGSAFEAFARMSEDERDAARRRETERAISWEEEVESLSRSVGIMGMIPELCEMSLLRLTSPAGRLDRILLRSETPREWAWAYATQVGVRDVGRYLAEQD